MGTDTSCVNKYNKFNVLIFPRQKTQIISNSYQHNNHRSSQTDSSTFSLTSYFSNPYEVAHQRILQLKAKKFTVGISVKSERIITKNIGLEERKNKITAKKLNEQLRKKNLWPASHCHFDTFLQKFTTVL